MTPRARNDRIRWPAILAIVVACASCSSPNVREGGGAASVPPPASLSSPTNEQQRVAASAPSGKGAPELARGIKSYEDGSYKVAARQFQGALDMGLDAKADQATAHKYLAFMSCVTGREKPCRDEFRKALDADPAFDLGPAEIGHPVWSSVLRSVRADATVKAKPK